VLLHHGLSAVIAAASVACGDASLTRLCLSFEIAEDVLQ